jgi:hypothetical protein
MTHEAPVLTPLTDRERAWLDARAAALPDGAGEVYAGPLPAGEDGRIVLSSDASASALPPLAGVGGVAPVLAEQAHVGAGQTLVITCPRRSAVRVALGRLSAAAGGRVVVETQVELIAATAAMEAGSVVELIGKDGKHGNPGSPGAEGTVSHMDGGTGGPGDPGGPGDDGPGGLLWYGEITGTLTVVAGGGNGGDAGPGGTGGHGFDSIRPETGGRGGNGGTGGRGGDAGNGGSVVIAFAKLAEGATIHPLARPNAPGRAGGPGPAGSGGSPTYQEGGLGGLGKPGDPGDAPAFSIRCHAEAPRP